MKIVFIIVTVCAAAVFCQPDFYGYFESEADYAALPQNDFFFNANKLRMDMAIQPNKSVSIGADVVAKNFQGETKLNMLDYLHQNYYPVLPDGSSLEQVPYSLSDTLYLDNAFIRIAAKRFDLTLGRQQISPGVGYVWNPTDVFNIKDITDPTYEQTGVDAARVDIPVGRFTFTSIVQFKNNSKETTQYYQLKSQLSGFDVAAVYARTPIYHFTPSFSRTTDVRKIYGLSAEGELVGGIGFRSEISLQQFNNSDYYSYIIGADYTFVNSLYMLTEYFHNDLGCEYARTSFQNYINYLAGYRKSLNQNYLYAMGLYPLGDLLDGGCAALFNADDESMMFIPQLVYRVYQDVELVAMLQISAGKNKSEFGESQGGLLRIRAYF